MNPTPNNHHRIMSFKWTPPARPAPALCRLLSARSVIEKNNPYNYKESNKKTQHEKVLNQNPTNQSSALPLRPAPPTQSIDENIDENAVGIFQMDTSPPSKIATTLSASSDVLTISFNIADLSAGETYHITSHTSHPNPDPHLPQPPSLQAREQK